MRIVLLGAPGCGKGTQGHRLAKQYRIPEISTGDLLREAVAAGTSLGKAAKVVMDAGQLVSDDIVLGVIRERLSRSDARKGFILDGFPRNLAQAEQIDELLGQLNLPIDLALLIDVDVDTIMQRLFGRRSCVSCGASYNIFYAPPKMDGRCDECGGRLRRRSDDNEETIGNRLRIYEMQTLPVVEYYREQGLLRQVQGIGESDDVFQAVLKVAEEAKKAMASRDRSATIRRAVARKLREQRDGDEAAKDEVVEPVEAGDAVAVKPGTTKNRTSATSNRKRAAKKKPASKTAASKTATKKAKTKTVAVKKAATGKKAPKKTPAKKTVAKKAAVRKKSGAGSKAVPAGRKKAVVGKALSGKGSVSKKKGVVKKKTVAKKKAATKKKAIAKKKPVAKKKAVVRKKTPARKKAVSRKVTGKPVVKKKAAAKNKAARRRR